MARPATHSQPRRGSRSGHGRPLRPRQPTFDRAARRWKDSRRFKLARQCCSSSGRSGGGNGGGEAFQLPGLSSRTVHRCCQGKGSKTVKRWGKGEAFSGPETSLHGLCKGVEKCPVSTFPRPLSPLLVVVRFEGTPCREWAVGGKSLGFSLGNVPLSRFGNVLRKPNMVCHKTGLKPCQKSFICALLTSFNTFC